MTKYISSTVAPSKLQKHLFKFQNNNKEYSLLVQFCYMPKYLSTKWRELYEGCK